MTFITPDNAAIRAKAEPAVKRAVSNLNPEVSKAIKKACY